MKRVLLTQRLVKDGRTGEVRDCLDVNWGRLLHALGCLAVPFPSRYPAADFLEAFPCDALVLTGGNDLESVSGDPVSAMRDAVEKELLGLFLGRDLPVIGVCRGMQLIGEAFGMGLKRVQGHVAATSPIIPASGSAYRDLLDSLGEVNSFHDFALSEVKAPFSAAAASPDGVIEAMECPEKRIFCQMWHSERRDPFSPAELGILARALEK